MRIDGFPILYFANDTDRSRAHHSPEMAECNIDLRQFVGAVSRVIADVSGDLRSGPGRFSLIEIWPETIVPPPRPMVYHVREQGRRTEQHDPAFAGHRRHDDANLVRQPR